MILKKMHQNKATGATKRSSTEKWKVYFGEDEATATAVTIFSKNTIGKLYNKPHPYIIHEPLLLEDLAPNQFEYKYYLDGYITRRRKFTKFDMAVETLKNSYKKLFNILARDPDINVWSLDAEEFKYLEDSLPDTNLSKFILAKLKNIKT